MTENEYRERRAALVSKAMRIDGRFFPRCLRARVRQIAQLDSEHDGTELDDSMRTLCGLWGIPEERRMP